MLWALAARRAAAGDGVALLERRGKDGIEEVLHPRRTSGGSDAWRFSGSGPGRGLLAAARTVGAEQASEPHVATVAPDGAREAPPTTDPSAWVSVCLSPV